MAGANSLKTIFYALGANSAIAVAKLAAAAITGSAAMLAEGIHSVADAGNQLLLLLGIKQSQHPPTAKHPLGYGKNTYFWSFVVAIILFSVGGMFSIYEGWHKLHEPQALSHPWVAIGVLVFAVLAETVSFRACIIEVNKIRRGRNFWRWFRDSRESELVVIFGEDLAALLGLLFALAAVVTTMLTGNPLFDALGTLMIGALLIIIAILIAAEVKQLLLGQSVEPMVLEQMQAFLRQHADVEQLYSLITLHMGKDVMVSMKLKMREFSDQQQMVTAINRLEVAFKQAFPMVVWSFVEPDNQD
ncbi:MAG: cation diffusion facilitator family transporter [Gammaproteobacteria bacterium]|nr:cation diffusion facilitator family transporter [Gammaproteobacteria bacterium]